MLINKNFLIYYPSPTNVFRMGYSTIDASGGKAGHIFQAPKTGTIEKICFAVVSSNGATLKASFQGVNASGDPDGTIKGASNGAFATQASPASNSYYELTLGESFSVTRGDWISGVVEFDSTVGNVQIGHGYTSYVYGAMTNGYIDLYTTSWTKGLYAGCTLPIYSGDTLPPSSYSFLLTKTMTQEIWTTGETGNKIRLPWQCRILGAYFYLDADNDYTVRIYDENNVVLDSRSFDTNYRMGVTIGNSRLYLTHPIYASKGQLLKLGVTGSAVTNIGSYSLTLNSADQMDFYDGGQELCKIDRGTGGSGAWTITPTRRMPYGFIIDRIGDESRPRWR